MSAQTYHGHRNLEVSAADRLGLVQGRGFGGQHVPLREVLAEVGAAQADDGQHHRKNGVRRWPGRPGVMQSCFHHQTGGRVG